MKTIFVLAGPNGAGKTTASAILLTGKLGLGEFVNADEMSLSGRLAGAGGSPGGGRGP